MAIARSRVLDLLKVTFSTLISKVNIRSLTLYPPQVQCRIYNHTFNPECIRTGNKVLRQRLIGPSVANYYPKRSVSLKEMMGMYPYLETFDEDEADRIDNLTIIKARGKGAPKKKRTAEGDVTLLPLPSWCKA